MIAKNTLVRKGGALMPESQNPIYDSVSLSNFAQFFDLFGSGCSR